METLLVILGIVGFLYLDNKLSKLSKVGAIEAPAINIIPRGEIWSSDRWLRQLAHLKNTDPEVKYDNLPKSEQEKLRKLLKKIWHQLYFQITLLYPQNIALTNTYDSDDKSVSHVSKLNNRKALAYVELGDIDKDTALTFSIERYYKKYPIKNKTIKYDYIPFLVGYFTKKPSIFLGKESENNIVFELPEIFIGGMPSVSIPSEQYEKMKSEFKWKSKSDYIGPIKDIYGENSGFSINELEGEYFSVMLS